MKSLFAVILTGILFLFAACKGEDRSGEQPFPPTVVTASANVAGGIVTLRGLVTASPNSTLTKCGFYYGNDTLALDTLLPQPAYDFSADITGLLAGDYYAVAYAVNYMGLAQGDTLHFSIP